MTVDCSESQNSKDSSKNSSIRDVVVTETGDNIPSKKMNGNNSGLLAAGDGLVSPASDVSKTSSSVDPPPGKCSVNKLPTYGSLSDCSSIKSASRARYQDRAITKDGVCNFRPTNVEKQNRKFMLDFFTTLLELQWRWTLTAFCVSYFGSWVLFAGGWYLIVFLHGDTKNVDTKGWRPCVSGIENFTSAFLFSVETQHTTGYGFYHLTEECPEAIILLCMQSIFGVILEGLMVGLVFIKMSRAKKRSETLMFSRHAVISRRDGVLHFMFRIGDMRKSHLLEAHVRAQLIRKRTTQEGEVITYHQEELRVGGDGEVKDKILLFWPTTVVHKITADSPLYNITEEDLHPYNNTFEIIVVLEGINESTGLTAQARSSYLPSEIKWGHRFENVTSRKCNSGERIIDYSLFNEVFPVTMITESGESPSRDEKLSLAV